MSFNFQGNSGWSPFPPRGGEGQEGEGPALSIDPGPMVKWVLLLGGLILLFTVLNILRGIYTNLLWFDEVEYRSVYLKVLSTRGWLFFAGALSMAALVIPNAVVAYRNSRGESVGPMPPEVFVVMQRLFRWGIVLGAFLVAVIFGSIVSGQWETVLRFFNAVPFTAIDPASGQTVPAEDPIFHRNISFYVFTIPVLNLVKGWLLGAVIATMLATASIYIINLNLRGVSPTIALALTPRMVAHISVLLGLLLFVITWGYWIDIHKLLFSSGGVVFGAAYTDLNARLPALRFLMVVGSVVGLLLLSNVYFRSPRIILGGIGLWVATAIVVGSVYPALVQRFQVDPNELSRERNYIANNIEFTRRAFALDRITEGDYDLSTIPSGEFAGQPAPLTAEVVAANSETLNNVRLWDPRPLMNIYNQIQFFRAYYKFVDVDVDRYVIDGEYRQVMLGARELFPEDLTETQSWVNMRLQYTHGYGVAMSPVTEFTTEGKPEFFIKDIPPEPGKDSLIGKVPAVESPQIYYGENSARYVIVNSKEPEFDYPAIEQGGDPFRTKYQGKGGVPLSSPLRRLAYAWEFADINVLISSAITPESRIQYRRLIQDRVRTIAPFLRLDNDPYLVVADGKLWWIQDAYTVTNHYPYSDPYRNDFNYIRNSVKAVINAYDGDVTFYTFDENDAIIQTYAKMFPTLFKSGEEMPPSLKPHIRYPEGLFTVQAEKYLIYHMQDTTDFYNKEDLWSIPQELYYDTEQIMEPYYVIMQLPGEEKEEFVLLLPFTPLDKPNQVAWLAARSDDDRGQYGTLKAFLFPKGTQVDGPQQIEARISNDEVIKEWLFNRCTGETRCIRGNLLVIPIVKEDEKFLLYVEPLYMQAANIAFPELKQVIVADAKRVVMAGSFESALNALLGEEVILPPGEVEPPPTGEPQPQQQIIDDMKKAIADLKDTLAQLEQSLGDLLKSTE
ncbi:MAG: putative glutamate--cysteine ligase/putative amino acid ligase [Dehalococcoidia bacterium]|nr:putative glutamate--cysteine ligase/putative amino acid ligase [Dehalococcoidia bacterium]